MAAPPPKKRKAQILEWSKGEHDDYRAALAWTEQHCIARRPFTNIDIRRTSRRSAHIVQWAIDKACEGKWCYPTDNDSYQGQL